MMSDFMSEKILICSYCKDEVDECDECGKKFRASDKIICLYDGSRHFCSKKCLNESLKEEALPSEVLSADED